MRMTTIAIIAEKNWHLNKNYKGYYVFYYLKNTVSTN